MNANEVAKAVYSSFLERFALQSQIDEKLKKEQEIRASCTHLTVNGKDAIVQQSEGQFDYCTGCGKTF